ncbi:MAG: response regulator [Polyangiaceae bacterium]|nr:response regulator [Polyangiaceae bacterium]
MTSLAVNGTVARGLEATVRDFVSSLPRRQQLLEEATVALAGDPGSADRRTALERTVRATAATARALGLELSARVLEGVELRLRRAAIEGPIPKDVLSEVSCTLSALNDVVAQDRGGRFDERPALTTASARTCVLVLGSWSLAEALAEAIEGVEVDTVDLPNDLPDRALALAPDAVVIDSDRHGGREAVEALVSAGLPHAPAIVVVGTFEAPEAAAQFAAVGAARVLPQPASADALARAIRAALEERGAPRTDAEPIGDVTIGALADRVATEVRRGLVGAAELGSDAFSVPLGDGVDVLSAVWASVARIRELVTMRSAGKVRFQSTGPEGAIVLAPWAGRDRGSFGGRRHASSFEVPLAHRRAVVVDDDPAVVWFLSGLLQAAGMEVLEAYDGEKALSLVLASTPDVIITDLLMPLRDGFSLARELKRDVVARDIPVVLLSWKDDLLERARELGADAEGYLRKEAPASVVLERVREVLRPRARVEARLQRGGEVRGRLDGLTPRLIVGLVCARGSDARVTFRDAAYLYEVEVRAGQVRSLTRSAPDGRHDRGEAALAGLLGAGAGRFAVTPESGPCRCDYDAPFDELATPVVARARAVLAALAPERLPAVARVELDLDRMAPYLAASPRDAGLVAQQLQRGLAPVAISAAGVGSPRLVADVLTDIAWRGAIMAVLGPNGEDLVTRIQAEPTVRRIVPAASDLPTPSPMFTFALSPAPLPLGGIGEVACTPLGGAAASILPPAPTMTESLAGTLPQVVPAGPPPDLPESASSPVEGTPSSLPPSMSAPDALRRPLPSTLLIEHGGALPAFGCSPRLELPPAHGPNADPPPHPEAGGVTVAAEPTGEERGSPVPAEPRPIRSEPQPAPTTAVAIKPFILFPAGKGDLGPSGQPSAAAATDIGPARGSPGTDSGPGEPASEPEPQPLGGMDPPARAIVFPPRGAPADAGAPGPTLRASSMAPSALDEDEDADVATSVTPPHAVVGSNDPGQGRGKPSRSVRARRRIVRSIVGAARVVGITAATALASFGLVRVVFAPSDAGAPQAASNATDDADTSAPTTMDDGVAAAPRTPAHAAMVPSASPTLPEARIEDLDLPPGFIVGEGKALLEVVTGGRESIYIDGTFVGRGPTRRVPLAPGNQEIEIRAEDGSRRQQVILAPGRRARVTFGG